MFGNVFVNFLGVLFSLRKEECGTIVFINYFTTLIQSFGNTTWQILKSVHWANMKV